ncbi:CaiB/BaiF CoA transferase family protein [Bordetella petrii]|uniref:CaiB/BaiF CoA transferase family protein n=1 Tax=Bordetella petrii TaxID=94624 RepID=UPI001E516C63|nr:CoA transferase [Bordetella petrii]MCD0504520.1 CoA transferase [Bordetella petrii]
MSDPRHPALGNGPLSGYRVLELGSTVAGPFCGRLLADFGADVIKVEPLGGDPVRTMGKQCDNQSLYAASILRNKSLVSIDLRSPAGQGIVRRLAEQCDVVIENFRPGGLEKWNLGYEALSAINPRIIMARISGFGQNGPYSERPGYGVIGEAVSGLRHVTGDPDRPPTRAAVSLTDCLTGLYAAFGILMAVLARQSTGKGQYIDAALYECAFSIMEPHVPAFDKLGLVAQRAGSRLPDSTPNNLYPTGDGDYIHITAMADAVFGRLLHAMGQPELAEDPRFSSPRARATNEADLDRAITAWTTTLTLEQLEAALALAEVPATRIFTMQDIFRDAHFKARDMLVDLPHDRLGSVKVAGVVPKLSETPGRLRRAGGVVGRDTQQIMADIAGYAPEEIEALIQAGIVRAAAAEPDASVSRVPQQ